MHYLPIEHRSRYGAERWKMKMTRMGMLGSSMLGAAMALAVGTAAQPPVRPVIAPSVQTEPNRKRKSKKRKAKAKEIVRRWGRGSAQANLYALKRDFNPARSSTLRKTQKLLRLQAA